MQLYFLSIATNLLAGVALAGDYLAPRFPGLRPLLEGLAGRTGRLTLGGITAAVGILKLLVVTPSESQQAAVVGDLVPALAGLVLGGSLVATALRSADQEERAADGGADAPVAVTDGPVEKAAQLALGYRMPLGLVGGAAAVLHFLFPGALLL